MAGWAAAGYREARTAAAEAHTAAEGRIAEVAAAMDSAVSAAGAWQERLPRHLRLALPFRRRSDILFARAEHRARIEGISS